MKIKHVLKDGTQVDSVEGHVIKATEHEVLYQVIMGIQRKEEQHEESDPCIK